MPGYRRAGRLQRCAWCFWQGCEAGTVAVAAVRRPGGDARCSSQTAPLGRAAGGQSPHTLSPTEPAGAALPRPPGQPRCHLAPKATLAGRMEQWLPQARRGGLPPPAPTAASLQACRPRRAKSPIAPRSRPRAAAAPARPAAGRARKAGPRLLLPLRPQEGPRRPSLRRLTTVPAEATAVSTRPLQSALTGERRPRDHGGVLFVLSLVARIVPGSASALFASRLACLWLPTLEQPDSKRCSRPSTAPPPANSQLVVPLPPPFLPSLASRPCSTPRRSDVRGDIGQPSRRFMRSSQGDSEGDARRSARGSSSSARSRSRRSRGRSGGDGGSSGGGGGGRGGGGGDDDDDDEDDEADDDAVIWGTTVRVGDATRAFRAFVRGFGAGVPSAADPHAQLAKYQRVSRGSAAPRAPSRTHRPGALDAPALGARSGAALHTWGCGRVPGRYPAFGRAPPSRGPIAAMAPAPPPSHGSHALPRVPSTGPRRCCWSSPTRKRPT